MSKVVIRCTREQWEHFRENTCPGRFDPNWRSMIQGDCDFEVHPDCKECWDEYAIWEDING